ncbi:DUF1015 family protein [Nocardioides sp. GXQ0305]|uniref:DUF1015 family protein n=1 Tax=Nocardioides sp. GXQ0305 TaxID=3423912 RepID=UPI003D7EAE1C
MDPGATDPSLGVAGPLRLSTFRALMLSPRRVGDPASARAFARPYRDVTERLQRWEKQGHLRHDDTPGLYLHEYTVDGLTVRGLVGALEVSHHTSDPEARVVLPHEAVEPRQSVELAGRMEQMDLNPAPILLVHRGPAEVRAVVHDVVSGEPWAEFIDRGQRWNRVWAIRDSDLLRTVAQHLAECRTLLADGHHRYAAYLQLQRTHPGTAADRGLAMLVDQDDTPLFLGAIHRTFARTSLEDLALAVEGVASFASTSEADAMSALGPSTLVATDGAAWARLELRLPPGRAAVEALHEEVVPRLRGRKRRLAYHHTAEETLRRLPRGGVAVLMPAPDFDLVEQIVSHHRLLPEKATSFQPKPGIGVLMRSLHDG